MADLDLDALLRDAEQYARVTELRGAVETEDQILTEVCNLLPEGSPERDAAHSTRLSGSRVGVLHLVSEWVRGAVEERDRLRHFVQLLLERHSDGSLPSGTLAAARVALGEGVGGIVTEMQRAISQ